jgi:glyoxylase-like metal-dependent hydrolase (beta-lactamase superfamily II)
MTSRPNSKDSDFKLHRIPLKLSNAFVIKRHEKGILVDAGVPGEAVRIIDTLEGLGVADLEWIFITHAHYDHMGSAAEIRRATGARVLIHEDDAEALAAGRTVLGEVRRHGHLAAWLLPVIEALNPVEAIQPDIAFNAPFVIPDPTLRIEAYHIPGHTHGSAGLLLEGKHFFAGDLLSTTGNPHPQRIYAQDWNAVEKSLKNVQELKPAFSYPGHGPRPLDLKDLLRLRI